MPWLPLIEPGYGHISAGGLGFRLLHDNMDRQCKMASSLDQRTFALCIPRGCISWTKFIAFLLHICTAINWWKLSRQATLLQFVSTTKKKPRAVRTTFTSANAFAQQHSSTFLPWHDSHPSSTAAVLSCGMGSLNHISSGKPGASSSTDLLALLPTLQFVCSHTHHLAIFSCSLACSVSIGLPRFLFVACIQLNQLSAG